jgi:caffeoyl-CoA O-methyltransferase
VFRALGMGLALAGAAMAGAAGARAQTSSEALDARVQAFLEDHRRSWHDMNVPYQDGKALFDLIVAEGFTRGLEIGTSTGHSTIWIAWAMSKTGGRLTTIEVDPGRHATALRNLEAVGLAPYVDARLADAHELVRELPGPYDFVFSDADKGWYTRYFQDLEDKLAPGACFTAHNVLNGFAGVQEFLDYVRARPGFTTRIDRSSRSGISISCRTPAGR